MENSKVKIIAISVMSIALILAVAFTVLYLLRSDVPLTTVSAVRPSLMEESSTTAVMATPAPTAVADIKINGGPENGKIYVKRLYELSFIFGITDFTDANKLPVSAAVQYAFCHLYYETLIDMPKSDALIYREALPESIQRELKNQFGSVTLDIKKSDLYNKSTDSFRMWQPQFNQNIVADAQFEEKDGKLVLKAVYYTDITRNTVKKKLNAVLQLQDKSYIFKSIATVK